MLDTALSMSEPMKSEHLLVREVDSKLYELRCTKRGAGFEIHLYLDQGVLVYRSSGRQVNVTVTHNGNYSIDFLENGEFYPKEGYYTKINLLGEAHVVADQIIKFLYETHLDKTEV